MNKKLTCGEKAWNCDSLLCLDSELRNYCRCN